VPCDEQLGEEPVWLPHNQVITLNVYHRSYLIDPHNEGTDYAYGYLDEAPYNSEQGENSELTLAKQKFVQVRSFLSGILLLF
jgi:hypothetical protein